MSEESLARNVRVQVGMTVRITPTLNGERTVLSFSGRIQSADVAELDKAIRSVNGPFSLDLLELISADAVGIKRLHELASSGIELRNASHYVQMILDDLNAT